MFDKLKHTTDVFPSAISLTSVKNFFRAEMKVSSMLAAEVQSGSADFVF